MKSLLKSYDFTTKEQYFDMCIESLINGQRTQAREQFNAIKKHDDRKQMLNYIHRENYNRDHYNFFFAIL